MLMPAGGEGGWRCPWRFLLAFPSEGASSSLRLGRELLT